MIQWACLDFSFKKVTHDLNVRLHNNRWTEIDLISENDYHSKKKFIMTSQQNSDNMFSTLGFHLLKFGYCTWAKMKMWFISSMINHVNRNTQCDSNTSRNITSRTILLSFKPIYWEILTIEAHSFCAIVCDQLSYLKSLIPWKHFLFDQ